MMAFLNRPAQQLPEDCSQLSATVDPQPLIQDDDSVFLFKEEVAAQHD
jgi:hypothetical protein